MKIIMKHLFFVVTFLMVVSCQVDYTESEYSYGNYTVFRQDWNGCMTKLSFYDREGNELGTTVDYYPGIGGWFLADLIFDERCVYYSACDACPKVTVSDSSQFVVDQHSFEEILIGKEQWRRISVWDDAPVVEETNKEYGSKVTRHFIKKSKDRMPDW